MDTGKPLEPANSRQQFPTLTMGVTILILYTTVSRVLNWDNILGPENDWITTLLSHLGLSQKKFHLELISINYLIILITIVCAVLLLLVKQRRYLHTRKFLIACLPLLALLAITGLSRFWSVAPGFTYARFNLLLAGALGGVLMGLAFQPRQLRTILEVFAALLVIGSLLVVILKPDYGITYDLMSGVPSPRWVGIFNWKMPAGMMMGFAAVVYLFRLLEFKNDNWRGRIFNLFLFGLSLVAMYKSNSMTEVLSVVAVFSVVFLGWVFIKWGHTLKPVHWLVLGGLIVFLLIVAWFEKGFFLGLIGRSDNLTGRLPLWTSLVPIIIERPLFGYGFGEAFWKNSTFYQPIWDQFPYFLPLFAHNGFIEALIDNGVVGLILWIVFLIQVAFLTLRYFFRKRTLSSLFFFSWVVFMVVMNVANNHLGSYETFTWLMLVISFASVVRDNIDLEKANTEPQSS